MSRYSLVAFTRSEPLVDAEWLSFDDLDDGFGAWVPYIHIFDGSCVNRGDDHYRFSMRSHTFTVIRDESPTDSILNVTPHPSESVPSKTWWDAIRARLPSPSIAVSLGNEDKSLIQQMIDTVKGAPKNISASFIDAFKHIKSSITETPVLTSLHEFVLLLCDVALLAYSSDDVAVYLLLQPSLLSRYGGIMTIALNAALLCVKQLLKHLLAPSVQGDGDEEDATWTETLVGAFNATYAFFLGSLPDVSTRSIIMAMAGANTAYNFFKHTADFGRGFINLIGTAARAVYKFATGVNWTPFGVDSFYADHAKWAQSTSDFMSMRRLTPDAVILGRRLAEEGVRLAAVAATLEIPKEEITAIKLKCDTFLSYLQIQAPRAEQEFLRGIPTQVALIGPPGKGKSLFQRLFYEAMITARKWTGEAHDLVSVYQNNSPNFQPPEAPGAKVLVIDDPTPTSDATAFRSYVENIIAFGTPIPLVNDQPDISSKNLHWRRPELILHTWNALPTGGLISNEAVARRFIGGIWTIHVADEFLDGNHINALALTSKNIDHAAMFVDTTGRSLNFTQWVSAINAAMDNKSATSAHLTQVASDIRASFKLIPDIDKPAVPTSVYTRGNTGETQWKADRTEKAQSPESQQTSTAFESQSFSHDGTFDDFFAKSYAGNEMKRDLAKFKAWAAARPENIVFSAGAFVSDAHKGTWFKAVLKAFVHDLPQTAPSWQVPAVKVTPAMSEAIRSKSFTAGPTCIACEGHCFVHGAQICDAYPGQPANYGAFVNFMCGVSGPSQVYHQILKAHTPLHESGSTYVLRVLGAILAGTVVGYAVGTLFNLLSSFYVQRYMVAPQSSTYSHNPKLVPARIVKVMSSGFPGSAIREPTTVQSFSPDDATTFLDRRLRENQVPISTANATTSTNSSIVRLIGNVAVGAAHAFPVDFNVIHLGGCIGASYPLVRRTDMKSFDNGQHVQYIVHEDLDRAWIILPKHINACTSLASHLLPDEFDMRRLTGLYMAEKPSEVVTVIDGRARVGSAPEVTRFGLGDCTHIAGYESKGSEHTGFAVHPPIPTRAGDSGKAVLHTNQHLAQGHRYLCGQLVAGNASTKTSIFSPLTAGQLENFTRALPDGVATTITVQPFDHGYKGVTLEEVQLQGFVSPIPPTARLPKSQTRFINTKHHIKRSLIYDALKGFTFYDPVDKRDVTFSEPSGAPAQLWRHQESIAKLKNTDHVLSSAVYNRYRVCASIVVNRVLSHVPARLTKLDAPTWDLTLNGSAELGITPVDIDKSGGFHPDFGNDMPGKSEVLHKVGDRIEVRPEHQAYVDKVWADMCNGIMPVNFVVDAPKPELRKVLARDKDGNPTDIKVPRNTNTMHTVALICCRRALLYVPMALAIGRPYNGAIYGSDLTGADARSVARAIRAMELQEDADAVNFDASEPSSIGSILDEMCCEVQCSVSPPSSHMAALCAAQMAHQGIRVHGDLLLFNPYGEISGHNATTPRNCFRGMANAEYCVSRVNDHGYHYDDVDHNDMSYGDDYFGSHRIPQLTFENRRAFCLEVGTELTTSTKSLTREKRLTPSDVIALKRRSWSDASGNWFWRLEPSVMDSIHAYIRMRNTDPRVATSIVAEAQLREFYNYGRGTFEKAKKILNQALLNHSCKLLDIDFNELDKDRRVRGSLPRIFDCDGMPVFEHVVPQSDTKTLISPTSDDKKVVRMDPNASNRADDSKGMTRVSGNTTNLDVTSYTEITPAPSVVDKAASVRNPFKEASNDDPLHNKYPVLEATWTTSQIMGDFVGSNVRFPEALLAVLAILNRVAQHKFWRGTITCDLRVGGSAFTAGALAAHVLPAFDTSGDGGLWRKSRYMFLAGKSFRVSAGKSEGISFDIPFSAPVPWYDLQNNRPSAANGSVQLCVYSPLKFALANAPTSITVILEARFKDLQLVGPDVIVYAPGPVQARRTKRSGVVIEDVETQSETIQKSVQGVMDGVKSSAKTAEGVFSIVDSIAPLAAMAFDKPTLVTAAQPVISGAHRDQPLMKGAAVYNVLAATPDPSVESEAIVIPCSNPQPAIIDLLQQWQYLGNEEVAVGDPKYTVVMAVPVRPTFVFQDPDIAGRYYPGMLGYIAVQHGYWSGSMKYRYEIFSPASQTMRLRFTWFPSSNVMTGVAPGSAGDPYSIIVDVAGDVVGTFRVPYVAEAYARPCGNFNTLVTDPFYNMGRVVVQIETPVQVNQTSGPVNPVVHLWSAMCEDGQVFKPRQLPTLTQPDFVTSTLFRYEKVEPQSAMRDYDGAPVPGIAPAQLTLNKGIVNGDYVQHYTELLKRMTLEAQNIVFPSAGTPLLFEPAPSEQITIASGRWPDKIVKLAPFGGWKGSMAFDFQVAYATPSSSVPNFLIGQLDYLGFGAATTLAPSRAGGAVECYNFGQVNPSPPFLIPYQDMYAYREVFGNHNELVGSENWWGTQLGTANTTVDLVAAMGDDLSVYHQMSPPPIVISASTPLPRGARAKTILPLAHKRGPTSSQAGSIAESGMV